jgi:hypothetical protein
MRIIRLGGSGDDPGMIDLFPAPRLKLLYPRCNIFDCTSTSFLHLCLSMASDTNLGTPLAMNRTAAWLRLQNGANPMETKMTDVLHESPSKMSFPRLLILLPLVLTGITY